MKTTTTSLIALIFFSFTSNSFAATNVPVDASSGEVVYKQTFKLNATFTDEDAYTMVQNWFSNAARFTTQNDVSGVNNKTLDGLFSNPRPLQSLDNEGMRMMGKGVIKFNGNTGSSINLLYLEYYVIIQVKGNELTATITKLQYHHYNRRSGANALIYSWQGGKPLDSADKFVKLVEGASSNKDINEVSTEVNKETHKLFNDLGEFLKESEMLANGNS